MLQTSRPQSGYDAEGSSVRTRSPASSQRTRRPSSSVAAEARPSFSRKAASTFIASGEHIIMVLPMRPSLSVVPSSFQLPIMRLQPEVPERRPSAPNVTAGFASSFEPSVQT